MSFSASPLVPGQPGSPAAEQSVESRLGQAVVAAAEQALAQIPSAESLSIGQPVFDVAAVALPSNVTTAVTGFFAGATEGKVLFVVGADLTDALAATPFGALEPAQALKPALETFADALGGRLDSDPTSIAVDDCFEVLSGGAVAVVPLLGADGPVSYLAASLSSLGPLAAEEPGQARTAGAAGAAGTGSATSGRTWGIDMLRDVEMEVTCELGRTKMSVRQLLALAPGDVVELDRLAGAPADLLVNGTLLARGEVVVVDESFGLRITEIVTRDAQ